MNITAHDFLDARGTLIAPAARKEPNWVPANGWTETPFTTRTGRRLLYVWDTRSGRHAYLDCQTDLVLSDEDARAALGY